MLDNASLAGETRPEILTVLNYYHPYVSGLSEYARLVAEGLSAAGYRVTVLCGRHRSDLPLEESINGVRVIRARPLFRAHKGLVSAEFVHKFRTLANRAHVLHLHLPMLESGLFTFLRPRSKPLIVTFQCDMAFSNTGSLIDRLAIEQVRNSSRYCCRQADVITVTSRDYARSSVVIGDLEAKWLEVFPPDKAPSDCAYRGPRRSDDGFRIGFLGRFVEEKGIGVLLDAFPQVLARYPGARLVLGGAYQSIAGGSQFDRIKDTITQLGAAVEVLGYVPDNALFDFYRGLDVFVLPSVNAYEAFGIVQVEAMKAGVPVVASDLPGVRLPVQITGNGLISRTGCADSLAGAILEVLAHPERYEPKSVAARAWNSFPAGRAVHDIDTAIGQMLQRSQPAAWSVAAATED